MKRFSLVWKRKMKVKSAFLLLVLCAEITGETCYETQVEFCDSERRLRCSCQNCISCQVGYGPSKQCGGSYLNGTAIKCIPCRPGIDFSEEDGIASCESCPQCDGRKTIRKCTPKRPSVCSSHECRKGYRMDPVVEDCVPITVVTSTSPITKKSTTLTKKTAIMTSLSSSNNLQSTSTNNKNISPTKLIIDKTLRPNQAATVTKGSEKATKNTTEDSPKLNIIIILVAVFMGVVVLVVMPATVWLCLSKRKTCTRPKQDVEKDEDTTLLTDMPSTNSSSPRSSEESIEDQNHPWPKNVRFQNIPSTLTDFLAVKISQPNDAKGWRMMGEELGVEEIVLDRINIPTEDGKSKGKNLFAHLKASTPSLTLSKVVSVLKKMDRNDLVEEIEKRMTLICKEGENDALV